MLNSLHEARALLENLGASNKLMRHLQLVGEAGDELVEKIEDTGVQFDKLFVQVGIAVHDVGKILHPEELSAKGNLHELSGEQLLLDNGVQKEIARCCVSHSKYDAMNVSFEELLVALADKLWKGKREPDLELRVIDDVAGLLSQDRWSVFNLLDSSFEEIALKGDIRLSRSVT